MRKIGLLVAIMAVATMAFADTVVVPNGYENMMGTNGLNSPIRQAPNSRTFVMQIPASELGSVPAGAQITGLEWRIWSGGGAWPPVNANWTNYDVYMGDLATAPGAMSTTIAANYVGGTRTAVRSGPMTIPAGAYTVGGAVNPWGYFMSFSTPYTYNGGGLFLELTHTGNDSGTTDFLDHPTEWGAVGSVYSGYNTTYNATTASFTYTGPLATRFTWVPEPASLLLLVLGGLALRRR